MLVFTLLGCFGMGPGLVGMPERYEQLAWLSRNVPLVSVEGAEVMRLEEFLVPQLWYADSVDPSTVQECFEGERVHEYIPSTYAHVEIAWDAIRVADEYTVSMSGKPDDYEWNGARIESLYVRLLELKSQTRLLSTACFPDVGDKLLVSVDPAAPAPLVWAVLESARQAGFRDFYLAVDDPVAKADAERHPAYPRFEPGAGKARERPPALSAEELAEARDQLARGLRVNSEQGSCRDRARLQIEPSGFRLSQEPVHTTARWEEQAPSLEGLKDGVPGEVSAVFLSPQEEATATQFLQAAANLHSAGETLALSPLGEANVGFLWGGTQPRIPVWTGSNSYESLEAEAWQPVIHLTMPLRASSVPCVDESGIRWSH